ncbi:signal transduction histidine kinase/CheY-like chemotaxis protein/HPt (histidine-containing phosphotransfer) domain-containing protein/predicted nucleic acid-binding protein [Clostridium algifaecis]|uniref:Stage 0 sporulation protein A homolog n=1 Tax=Clostridium algifaecis TaxID=1472040 RepID=A0ABS4KR67_9CLOT|nr:ATP-binding protein [Clostridium algifaecis]MBP2031976.1 signal transduction histidine kinase/CheY-like chemotaxis protein/HPt (histidine-containing phosphotransfer) domain-containing protein/predicted nucleic acid-binding protein [Clostridium algifaecis]
MRKKIEISQTIISIFTLFIFLLIVVLLGESIIYMKKSIDAEQAAVARKEKFKQLGIDLADASSYLTNEARKFVVTKNLVYLDEYWKEINVKRSRDKVIYKILKLNTSTDELYLLSEAKKNSDGLIETDKRAMKLVLEATQEPENNISAQVAGYDLSESDKKLNKDEKLKKAIDIMFDAKYESNLKAIMDPIQKFQISINNTSERESDAAREARVQAEILQIVLDFIIVIAIIILLRIIYTELINPVKSYAEALLNLKFSNNFKLIPKGSKELRTLADNFNEMYHSLQNELVKRKEAEQKMKIAKNEAVMANKAKGDFLANMSHEIRTPLNAIIGHQYLLSNDTDITVKQKVYTDKIGISAKNLLGIINNILDFSKIEAEKLVLEFVTFDINNMINELSSILYFEIRRKKIKFDFCISSDVPEYLKGDQVRIKQILLNLLSNAIKFTKKGEINIDVKLLEKINEKVILEFRVKDTGIGITEEQKRSLFEPFIQGDASTTRKYGGTGLGLAISKNLVELMGGKIDVKSEFGKGTTFIFNIKLEISSEDEIDKDEKNEKIMFKNKRVLLVEDDVINLEMTKEILQNIGLETDVARNGISAINKVINNSYDVVLMDIQMPDMDGYETTANIRKIKGAIELPIIALSAEIVDGVINKTKRAGMNDYLTKPIDINNLVTVIKKYVKIDKIIFNNTAEPNKNHQCSIDYNGVIEKIGGKKEKYKSILEKFIVNHSEDGRKLYNYIISRKMDLAKILLHTMKGVSGNIGAYKLMKHCLLMEKAIKKEDKKNLLIFEKDFEILLKQVIDDGNRFIENNDIKEDDNKKIFTADNKEKLYELSKLLESGDVKAKETFYTCGDYLIKKFGEDVYNKLNKKIYNYEFEDACKDVIELINKRTS